MRLIAAMLLTIAPQCEAQETLQDPFASGVRDTEPLTPAEQQQSFRLPPGFSIQLVAAEPQIAKPMNLAFDARGRLWVSSSEEYPFAAPADRTPKDTIRILEDTNGDGRMDKVTTFADELNIPIGLYPYQDGVICFSIPNILFLRDTDGDGKADTREVLYGPFDTTRDTHGMCNAFRCGPDGWIYACHGFNNRSEVTGRDGNKVVMHSGNTFRFRPDGSRIEHFTVGQVNPFGMSIDRFGDIFTADCHTKPVTLLLQGGNYDSFGRPHDGLGYVPNVMEHLHGSTAIAGIALGQHTDFPAEYQDSSFGGNVMTSRINRNRLAHVGSSVQAKEEPDLCSTTDPWFRPVDLIPGPDGALYIADFYNRIIGHYEVDLYHPGRDRFRGRIWKIQWTGNDVARSDTARSVTSDISELSLAELISRLETVLSPLAVLISDRIADKFATDAVAPLRAALNHQSPVLRSRSLQLLLRLGKLDQNILQQVVHDDDELVRVHGFRALNELSSRESLSAEVVQTLLGHGFSDASPLVRRTAVLASSRHQQETSVRALMDLFRSTAADDVHLRHAIRMAVRDHLRNDDWFRRIANDLAEGDVPFLADICLALRTPAAGEFIAARVDSLSQAVPARLTELLQFAAGYVSPESASVVATAVEERFRDQPAMQLQLLNAMKNGFNQRGQQTPVSVSGWAERMTLRLLKMASVDDLQALQIQPSLPWRYVPYPETSESDRINAENPWVVSSVRSSTDGMQNTPLFSSIDKGEQQTGIHRSANFVLTEQFSFYVAGHDGFPNKPEKNQNFVRLIDATTKDVLKHAAPPRNDVAHPVVWDTSSWKDREAYLELVDGDSGTAYAWLAVGRFSEPRLNPGDDDQRRLQAAGLVGDFGLTAMRSAMVILAADQQLDRELRSAVAVALVRLNPETRLAAAALIPQVKGVSGEVVDRAMQAVIQHDPGDAATALEAACQTATSPEQQRLAEQLCVDPAGAETLVRLIENGKASSVLLRRPTIQQRMAAVIGNDLKERIEQLTANLPDEAAATEKKISTLRKNYQQHGGDATAGQALFRRNCNVCHQVAGEGRKVGPNLDGLGNRGLDRMAEDILAPNRNVDIAFRTTTVVTTDGKAYSGLLRELEDNRVSIIDSEGKEIQLDNEQIDERLGSKLSPMPVNFVETLSDQQLRDLMAYLLSLRH